MVFSIRCVFKEHIDLEEFNLIRPKHQEYIKPFVSKIKYGGIVLNEENQPQIIYIFIEENHLTDAEKFIKNDPNYSFYKEVEINHFTQRIPFEN